MADLKRRTQILIAKSFQIRFAVLLSLVGIAVTAVVGIVLYIVFFRTQTLITQTNVILSQEVIEFLQYRHSLFVYSLFGTFVVVTLTLLVVGIYISHRLAGPIFALSRRMNDVAQGNFTAVLQLRETDEFQELKDKFNTLVRGLQNQVKGEIIKITSISDSLRKVLDSKTVSGQPLDQLKSAFLELQSYHNYKKSLIEPPTNQRFKPTEATEDEVLV